MAHDAGVSVNEFRELASHSSNSADLMLERMLALDLDAKGGRTGRTSGIPGYAARVLHVQNSKAVHSRSGAGCSKPALEGVLPERANALGAGRVAVGCEA